MLPVIRFRVRRTQPEEAGFLQSLLLLFFRRKIKNLLFPKPEFRIVIAYYARCAAEITP
jgi:hypothetical protein